MTNKRADFGYYFNVGQDVLNHALDPSTNVPKLQLGDSTTGESDSDGAELWGQPGIVSAPAAPTSGNASCQTVVLKRGDHDIVLALRDVRTAQMYGSLKAGETAVFATTGQARTLYKNNGAIVHYTTSTNAVGGSSMTCEFGPDGFHVVTPWGTLSLDSNGFSLTMGQAGITLTPAGLAKMMGAQASVLGSVVACSGTLGTFLGPTASFVPVQAALAGLAGPTGKPSSNVFLAL